MKLYLINTKWDLGKIKECEVIKETEKTYTIKRNSLRKHLIRKSEMRVYDSLVCETYEEAEKKSIELLKQKIEKCKIHIKQLYDDIERYNTMLADRVNECGKIEVEK